MSDDPNKNWTDEEAATLRSLRDEPVPSAGLEDRIVDALKRRGSIRAQGGLIRMAGRTVALAAAAAVVFIGGFVLGGRRAETAPPSLQPAAAQEEEAAAGKNEYMLLMFSRASDARAEDEMPAEKMQAIIGEYRQWAMDREKEGRLVSAEKLASATRIMTESGGDIAIASSSDSERVLGGYFLITAHSLEEAIDIARTHPHLKYGGEVEVRPIEITRH